MLNGFKPMTEDAAAPWQGTDSEFGVMFPALFAAADARNARIAAEDTKREADILLRFARKDAETSLTVSKVYVLAVGAAILGLGAGAGLGRTLWTTLVGVVLLLVLLAVAARAAKNYFTAGQKIAEIRETASKLITDSREAAAQADQRATNLQHEADRGIKILPEEKDPPATSVAVPAE